MRLEAGRRADGLVKLRQIKFKRRRLGMHRLRHHHRTFAPTHHGVETAGVFVETKHPFGQLRLHAEHVDQEAKGAEVVGQTLEQFARAGQADVHLGIGQRIHFIAHAQAGMRRLVETQHRQHAAHRGQLAGHGNQQLALRRVAEIVVGFALDLGQAGAQFVHDAAQGLAVGHAAVQHFHPRFERLGGLAAGGGFDPGGQALHALGLFGMIERRIVQRGLDVEHAGRHFHGQTGHGRLARTQGADDGALQGFAQHFATGKQARQRFGNGSELLVQPGQPVGVALGRAGP